ncbi:hypothetical protein NDR87_36760 [Nocardia sp. CDC159]|uniref:Peptidase inhibitor family I36 n=1 Tax=Nocardia pulmonis TaxID=2951408 RepID=A0A9X2EDS5_9NOCA|nr:MULTISPECIES: hypothetical protein [Nocardia]MCM6779039.1 hypothetical protein [Nocardia pulmonis]MCM6791929.1 hypothetical protein [Nocardia sp. CDC159]
MHMRKNALPRKFLNTALLSLLLSAAALAPTIPAASASDLASKTTASNTAQPDGEALPADAAPLPGTCGDEFKPIVGGDAWAYWKLTCSGGWITMSGWVDDLNADGKCAYVRGEFNDKTFVAKNCPATSPKTNFSWSRPGRFANGYLYVR